MRYYWYNRQELLQETKDKYHNCGGKERTAEYYTQNNDVRKETNNNHKNLSGK